MRTTVTEEWAATVLDRHGHTQYIAAAGTRDRYGQPATFTRYRGSSARYTSENAALARGYAEKDATSRGQGRHPWITDVRAERIR